MKKRGILRFFANNIVWTFLFFKLISIFLKKTYNMPISEHVFFIMFPIEILSITRKDIFLLVLFTILITSSITDIINNDVFTVFNILVALLGLIYKTLNPFSFVAPLVLLFINHFIKGMGLGDIELIAALAFSFDLYDLVWIIFLSSILNILWSIFDKKKMYPFVPFLTISTFIIYRYCSHPIKSSD